MKQPLITPAITQPTAADLRQIWNSLTPAVQAEFTMAAIAIGLGHLFARTEQHELPAWQTASAAKFANFFKVALIEGAARASTLAEVHVLGSRIDRLESLRLSLMAGVPREARAG